MPAIPAMQETKTVRGFPNLGKKHETLSKQKLKKQKKGLDAWLKW
jgi:hypothetical protein